MNLARLRVASIDFSRAPISQCVEVRNLLRRMALAKVVKSELILNAGASAWIDREDREEGRDDHYLLLAFSLEYRDLIFEVTVYDSEDDSMVVERSYYCGGMFGKAKITQEVPTFGATTLTNFDKLTVTFYSLMADLASREGRLKARDATRELAAQARAKLTPDELSALLTFPT